MKNPDDYVLVKRGVLLGAALILERMMRGTFHSGNTEPYEQMRAAADGPAVKPQEKTDWRK